MFTLRLRTKQVEPTVEVKAIERLRAQYIHFCRGPFFTTKEVSEHFDALLQEPIQHVGFTTDDPPRLVIASLPIWFKDPFGPEGSRFEIGPMLAFYERDVANHSRCTITFERITPAGHTFAGNSKEMHPHISSNGNLCISKGRESLVQAICHGDLLLAVRMTISILNTYNPDTAYPDYSAPRYGIYGDWTE